MVEVPIVASGIDRVRAPMTGGLESRATAMVTEAEEVASWPSVTVYGNPSCR